MSAWELTKTEIDVLVYWFGKTGVSNQSPTTLGRMLWAENYKSIRARYGEYDWKNGKYRRTPEYHYSRPATSNDFQLDNQDQALKMCHFYNYQSCEHDGWNTSRAKHMISKLENHLIAYGADWQRGDGLKWGVA